MYYAYQLQKRRITSFKISFTFFILLCFHVRNSTIKYDNLYTIKPLKTTTITITITTATIITIIMIVIILITIMILRMIIECNINSNIKAEETDN